MLQSPDKSVLVGLRDDCFLEVLHKDGDVFAGHKTQEVSS